MVTGASAAPRIGAPSSGTSTRTIGGACSRSTTLACDRSDLHELRSLRGQLLLLQVSARICSRTVGFFPAQTRLVRLIERLDLLLGDQPDLGRHLGVEERRDRHPPLRRLLGQETLRDEGIELLPL